MRRLAFAALLFLVAACGGEQMAADPASSKTATTIEQDLTCRGVTPPAGMRLLRIADGAMHYDLQMVDKCSPHPGVFTGPLAPATHPRDSVVVFAPTAATFLWLEYEKTAYRWPVRPPV
jgi:hypothetical protein